GRRPVVVVNLSEGEPASAKDHALATRAPHLILDGATATARALKASQVHLVLPGDRPAVRGAIRAAIAERSEEFVLHLAQSKFVAGQAQAVIQLMNGRANLPVTAWQPEAISGHRGRPTLLSNAETWAQVGRLLLVGPAAYAALGTPREPGTTLLTFSGTTGRPQVVEAEYGSRLRDHLPAHAHGRPALVGGFHGTWVTWQTLASMPVSHARLRVLGTPLGAGVVIPAGHDECPIELAARIATFLAGQSARRCGPCLNGLPALAEVLRSLADGGPGPAAITRIRELGDLVTGRGACAHPDGTARMARSLLAAFPGEVSAHTRGRCTMFAEGAVAS
ncbi:NADH-ubiquinone oxidoreductase-F iron-sulfur binding region domain-containing protein, partial [Nocardioides sp.]|uniref:NADH-ubiquinone oxidoreductase-F iron-sulfur binding region domain-containing protein n=1 Tax=Nocardioides sp. TaxID=35761 RepID=UPI003562108D